MVFFTRNNVWCLWLALGANEVTNTTLYILLYKPGEYPHCIYAYFIISNNNIVKSVSRKGSYVFQSWNQINITDPGNPATNSDYNLVQNPDVTLFN